MIVGVEEMCVLRSHTAGTEHRALVLDLLGAQLEGQRRAVVIDAGMRIRPEPPKEIVDAHESLQQEAAAAVRAGLAKSVAAIDDLSDYLELLERLAFEAPLSADDRALFPATEAALLTSVKARLWLIDANPLPPHQQAIALQTVLAGPDLRLAHELLYLFQLSEERCQRWHDAILNSVAHPIYAPEAERIRRSILRLRSHRD